MLSRETPLRGHELFRTANAEELCREIHTRIGARCHVPESGTNFSAQVSRYEMPSSELWYAEFGVPVRVECPEGPFIRLQIQRACGGVTSFAGQSVTVDASQSGISPAEAVIECGAGFQQLVWHVRHDDLIRRLVALTGAPVSRKLTFEPAIKRSRPESKAFIAILNGILANIDHATVLAPPFVLAELEEALMVSMLLNFQHSQRELLEQKVLDAGSWQVKRVEEYIEAHLDAPFDIGEIAAVTGISTRSIYRAFQRSRGYSPMAFARKRRLQRARRMLEGGEQNQTVTAVAFGCGFNDVGHFSREFSKAFGESPSTVLGRSHRGAVHYR
jgi:AraC-like DNA-binding protein